MQESLMGVILMAAVAIIGLGVSLLISKNRVQKRASIYAFVSLLVLIAVFCFAVIIFGQIWSLPIFIGACIFLPILVYGISVLTSDRSAERETTISIPQKSPVEDKVEDLVEDGMKPMPASVNTTPLKKGPVVRAQAPIQAEQVAPVAASRTGASVADRLDTLGSQVDPLDEKAKETFPRKQRASIPSYDTATPEEVEAVFGDMDKRPAMTEVRESFTVVPAADKVKVAAEKEPEVKEVAPSLDKTQEIPRFKEEVARKMAQISQEVERKAAPAEPSVAQVNVGQVAAQPVNRVAEPAVESVAPEVRVVREVEVTPEKRAVPEHQAAPEIKVAREVEVSREVQAIPQKEAAVEAGLTAAEQKSAPAPDARFGPREQVVASSVPVEVSSTPKAETPAASVTQIPVAETKPRPAPDARFGQLEQVVEKVAAAATSTTPAAAQKATPVTATPATTTPTTTPATTVEATTVSETATPAVAPVVSTPATTTPAEAPVKATPTATPVEAPVKATPTTTPVEAPVKATPTAVPTTTTASTTPTAAPAVAPSTTAPAKDSVSYAECYSKATAFRDKGLQEVAARLYEESAQLTTDQKEKRDSLFAAISCYVKIEKLAEAKKLALAIQQDEIESLTLIQVMKLDAVLRAD